MKVSDFATRRAQALSLPIVMGSTYELDDTAHGARLHDKKEAAYADGDGYVYARWGSPTNEGAARQLAALEGIGPEDDGGCMLFSSGMAAITSALQAALRSGDHAVLPYTVYGGTHEFLVECTPLLSLAHAALVVAARASRLLRRSSPKQRLSPRGRRARLFVSHGMRAVSRGSRAALGHRVHARRPHRSRGVRQSHQAQHQGAPTLAGPICMLRAYCAALRRESPWREGCPALALRLAAPVCLGAPAAALLPRATHRRMPPSAQVVYTESPANPTCRLTDLEAVAKLVDAHAAKGHARPLVMCDSTFASPYHQRCCEVPGVDVAIHSATKYIGGHSDILAGAVTAKSDAYMHELAKVQKILGAPRRSHAVGGPTMHR